MRNGALHTPDVTSDILESITRDTIIQLAREKLKLFAGTPPREVRSPRSGTLMTILVTPGQTVPQAATLATVADLSRLWIRVAVPESDLSRSPSLPTRYSSLANSNCSR